MCFVVFFRSRFYSDLIIIKFFTKFSFSDSRGVGAAKLTGHITDHNGWCRLPGRRLPGWAGTGLFVTDLPRRRALLTLVKKRPLQSKAAFEVSHHSLH